MTHPISYPADPSQNPQGRPPRARRRVWPWIVVGVPVLLFGACSIAVVSSVGGEKEATVISGPTGEEVVADRGPEFPGKLDHDTAAVAGATISRDDLAYTVGPLQAVDSLLGSYLCSEVTIVNVGTAENDFNGYTDWHVQDAGGAIRDSTFGTDRPMLQSGRLAPGGTATGNVCFDARSGAAPGTYIVLYEDTFSLSTDRLAWVSAL
ncbi:DUF4352 domain-containing protein [Rhodococcus coprophilus]|uniref:Telomeric repeat-binding factor 2 n=2 Tax=Nocardiaceae TaxID=85025 RepID=A0A2X4TR35_9NOCA|nr:DUF4352 domain-containing protein [Rhodococcus coprophilus]MBM7457328.1 hypothetical protein [Rhodococcus coprophilus]SQI29541.1 Telomeric repeat-binding factor 2 [Rhodococcus coprophilus]